MQKFGGISRYYFELMKHSENVGYDYELSLLLSSNDYLKKKNRSSFFDLNSSRMYRFTNQINKQYSFMKIKYGQHDIFHPTYFDDYYVSGKGKPYVITVYDLIVEKFPQYFGNVKDFVARKKNVVENASRVIVISENTKKDLLQHYDVKESKIDVTYLAESLSSIESHKIEGLPAKYILFVGKRRGYKNFDNFYEAAKDILRKEADVYLVCAGGGEFLEEEIREFRNDRVDTKIKYIVFKDNKSLKYIYENAIIFVFPSLYEGFGIPVLESFASGCLTCLSDSSSLKEIAGKGALYFDPDSPEDIKACIERSLLLSKVNKYTEEASKVLKKFTWEKTAKNTFDVYKKC